jgi:putative flippase GtrA
VSAASNYWWNRHWTFAHQKGSFAMQGMRFYVVSIAAFAVNQLWLAVFLDWLNWGKTISQALAIILVTPLNFLGNKLWSFRR